MKKVFSLLLIAAMTASLCACSPVGKVEIPEEAEENEEGMQQDPPELSPAEAKAAEILSGMTVEQKVGQMFLARCPEQQAAEKCAQYALGGYILFGRDFENKTPEEAKAGIAACQSASTVPMIIATDEEGGTVNRVSRYKQYRSNPFHSPSELYAEGGLDFIINDTAEKCRLLLSLGVNVNMAPVCDITTDPQAFMYNRSLRQDAETTSLYASVVASTCKSEGMGCVLKHFPGYGNAADTHTGGALDQRDLEEFYQNDFLPFKAGIDSGAGAVLVCHNTVTAMDSQNPASLSPEVHRILREELGFDGVIVTDDLYMEAITGILTPQQAAVSAVLAGNDLICCTEFELQVPAVIEAVSNGTISESRIDESVMRILLWKMDLGIIPLE